MSKELLLVAEAAANEKGIDKNFVFEALETALAAATRKRFHDDNVEIVVRIDRKTGEYSTFRLWHIVDDDDFLDNPSAQLRETIAQFDFPDIKLNVGDTYEQAIGNEPFGRIAAQNAKNIIIQKLREAEREKIYKEYADKQGELIYGEVVRYEKGNAIININGTEAIISKHKMIPKETLRLGDRVLGYLEKVNREARTAQLEVSRTASEFLIALFRKEVPEIGNGNIEIMGATRDPGLRAKIAVRSLDPRVDAIGACVGIHGSRIDVVTRELAGESIDIVLWDEDPEVYISKAMSPATISKTYIDYDSKTIDLAVPEDKLSRAVGRGGQNVKLASDLTGWKINVLDEAEFEKKCQEITRTKEKNLVESLEIAPEIASVLVASGYETIEEIAYAQKESLLEENNFDDKTADSVLEAASNALLKQAFEEDEDEFNEDDLDSEMQTPISNIDGISNDLVEKLQLAGINTQEDLAELSVDELKDIGKLDEETASNLIMKAREPWFREE